MDIIIKERSDDYIAFLYGEEETWESGKTQAEAIGKLIISLYHGSKHNVIITYRGK